MSVTQPTTPDKTRFVERPGDGCNSQVSAGSTAETAPVELALAPALRLRLLGTGLVATGFMVALGFLVVWLAGAPPVVGTGLAVLGGFGVLALGLLLGVRRWVLRLDAQGFRVRVLRSGATSARWTDVLDVQAINDGPTRCVVLRLRDGRTTVLPVDALEAEPARLTQLLTEHLDRGHGYRRLS